MIPVFTCPVCGKKYVPAGQHVYKIDDHFVCSWGCQRKAEKEKEARKAERKKKKKGITEL